MASGNKSYSNNQVEPSTFFLDVFASGVTFGSFIPESPSNLMDNSRLALNKDVELLQQNSRYSVNKKDPVQQLEKYLMQLSGKGILHSSQIFLGVNSDPFHPFEGRFDTSIKLLDLFKRYTPGMLWVQTRSPLIVLALPVFSALKNHICVTIGIESPNEQIVRSFTPGLPRVEERLKTATALRRFGVEVHLQVSPLLPYGDWQEDAKDFASILDAHADYLYVAPLTDGSAETERLLRKSILAKRLAESRKFHWLRPDSAKPLIQAIKKIAPEKLIVPERKHLEDKQLSLFAA